jgi:serine/threonine-protein kinase
MAQWRVPGYTGLKVLGSGGFGEVVLAKHDGSGTMVAVKYLRGELLADPEFVVMFREEAAVLAAMADPNVVRLYEYVESPSGAAIVMELIGGVSLREILHYQGKTTAEAALVVLQGSLLGLAAAHRRGVVHRDYKPENVLVDGEGVSKLTDFGIAARAGDRPFPAGTLHYAPPEQMAGAPASPAGDVYSATATFYECLTGSPPFRGGEAELLHLHRVAAVPLEPVPESLRPLVTAGMAKDPRRRPADAAAFVTGLREIAEGAYGPGWDERGRSHLGEAALLLAALWPAGAPPAVQGYAVHRIPLNRQAKDRARHRQYKLRQLSAAKAALAAAALIAVAAAGTALATTHSPSFKTTASDHPVAAPTHSVSLGSSSAPPAPATGPASPSPKKSPSAAPAAGPTTVIAPTTAATSATPTKTASPSPTKTKSPSPSPSPSKSKSPSPTPSPTTSSPTPTPTPTPSPSPSPSPSSSPPPGR